MKQILANILSAGPILNECQCLIMITYADTIGIDSNIHHFFNS